MFKRRFWSFSLGLPAIIFLSTIIVYLPIYTMKLEDVPVREGLALAQLTAQPGQNLLAKNLLTSMVTGIGTAVQEHPKLALTCVLGAAATAGAVYARRPTGSNRLCIICHEGDSLTKGRMGALVHEELSHGLSVRHVSRAHCDCLVEALIKQHTCPSPCCNRIGDNLDLRGVVDFGKKLNERRAQRFKALQQVEQFKASRNGTERNSDVEQQIAQQCEFWLLGLSDKELSDLDTPQKMRTWLRAASFRAEEQLEGQELSEEASYLLANQNMPSRMSGYVIPSFFLVGTVRYGRYAQHNKKKALQEFKRACAVELHHVADEQLDSLENALQRMTLAQEHRRMLYILFERARMRMLGCTVTQQADTWLHVRPVEDYVGLQRRWPKSLATMISKERVRRGFASGCSVQ